MLPENVRVGPFTYGVCVDQPAIDRKSVETQSDLWGASSHRELTISLAPNLAPMQERDTLLHEVLHCIVALGGRPAGISYDDEENFVRLISSNLLDALQRNPEFVQYLLEHGT